MDASLISALGLLAASLTTIAYVPQVVQTYRARSGAGLSLPMLLLFSTGVLCWLLYGLLRHDWPVILANAATLSLTVPLLLMKLRFK
ncbi:SemiSWEET transporter [Hymenobacter weizhouensis]|uniref:SemiSWEET transporter n=1 Tax=Hymenobacter sp. YIM 151500-1 TaxID=2987689 RepID=UPI002226AB64|nr:SemiSWEET transporter [Hymenobacter sp. YIM 151500-1]UYZ64770.1 SemiSWEET transporter [Hymenobacter sp. YIM 151500-1]